MSDPIPSETPVARALARLDLARIRYETVEHAPAYTTVAEADAAHWPPQATAKTLVLLDHDRTRLAVIPASRRLDLDRTRRVLRASRHLRLASEEEAAGRFPDFEIGAVPAFAVEVVPEVIDARLLYHETVLCSAGDHRHGVLLDPRDLFRLAEPRVADICVHEPGEHRFAEAPRV